MSKMQKYLLLVAVLIIAGFFFFVGYKVYPGVHPLPIAETDTVFVYDTVTHTIVHDSIYFVNLKPDTIIYHHTDTVFPENVVPAEILRDYYAYHFYRRDFGDSLFSAILEDVVSENRLMDDLFTYKILRPQEVINNVVNNYSYSKYLYLGLSVNIPEVKNSEFALLYAFSRGYIGAGYSPFNRGASLKGGIALFKIK